jgi:hypothetical protein
MFILMVLIYFYIIITEHQITYLYQIKSFVKLNLNNFTLNY